MNTLHSEKCLVTKNGNTNEHTTEIQPFRRDVITHYSFSPALLQLGLYTKVLATLFSVRFVTEILTSPSCNWESGWLSLYSKGLQARRPRKWGSIPAGQEIFLFSTASSPPLGAERSFPGLKQQWGETDTNLHAMPRLRMVELRSDSPISLMAYCLIKRKEIFIISTYLPKEKVCSWTEGCDKS